MTLRERILSVYRGITPDVVPFMLDLSHYYYHKNKIPWDLSRPYTEPEHDLIDYHRKMGAGFYLTPMGCGYSARYTNGVTANTKKETVNGIPVIRWSYETPLGKIERRRIWEEDSYSWGIREWSVQTEKDLRILAYALGSRTFEAKWDEYRKWVDYTGDQGVVYMSTGYSAIGYLLSLWMGIEGTMYATADMPEVMEEAVEQINESNLKLIDLLADSPAEIVIGGDNISSDVQPPHFFEKWSKKYYAEAARRLHAKGKFFAIHVDGRLKGALKMTAAAGADCADAVTPKPMGDLTPAECRKEAGNNYILSGGVPPDLWLPDSDLSIFKKTVTAWLELKETSPRFIANAGDQVPPFADEKRIMIMRELVEKHGKY